MNNLASNKDLNFICCNRCTKHKHKREFVKEKKNKNKNRAWVPLGELGNNIIEEVRLVTRCRECREEQKTKSRNRENERKAGLARVNNAKLDSYSMCSWEEAQRMIDEGYSRCSIKLTFISSSFEAHKEVLISDFYHHLPEDIPKDNKQAIGQYILDELSRAEED